jgi:hypothetical protein
MVQLGEVGDFLGLVASNLIAGECVIEREEGAGLKTRLYNRWKRAYTNGEEPGSRDGPPRCSGLAGQVAPTSTGWAGNRGAEVRVD